MKPGIGWPIGIACILGATIVGNLMVMRIAGNDPAFAVEPDYYRKAVQYDSTMAQERRNLALGWQVRSTLSPISATDSAELQVVLTNANAEPLRGAQVQIMARFNARANDTLTATLQETRPGRYRTLLPVQHAGEWEVRVDARLGDAHWLDAQRVQAVRLPVSSDAAP
jgi:nitrogen fixation protein FixH